MIAQASRLDYMMLKHLSVAIFLPILFLCSLGLAATWNQQPFGFPVQDNLDADAYEFKWPIRKVAIIGAGPSGMISYRELTRTGLDVRMFERDDVPGGNWHYTEEAPVDAPIPNAEAVVGDYVPSLPPDGVELPYSEEYLDDEDAEFGYYYRRREHRGPKPVWESLTSNVPAPWQQITELPWPAGTPWELTHYQLRNYMRSFASFHGINGNDDNCNVSYDTRVELVEKNFGIGGQEHGWTLTLKKFVRTGPNSSKATWWTEKFDAVVVATGRYNAPYIPRISGLSEWSKRFPGQISHSRQYRHPEPYTNETVLIVGAAASGGEISRDLNRFSKKIYQSVRLNNSSVSPFPLSSLLRPLPRNTTVIPEIKRFRSMHLTEGLSQGEIELVNGTVITGIDRIIFATGFRYSFPFLPQYHNSSVRINESATGAVQPLVTDGTHIRSLHLDLFYIEEPTIGFINMNLGILTFIYAEYLSLALAKVWANKAKLPPTKEMWGLYRDRLEDYGGYGKYFQYLGMRRLNGNIRYFVGWLNDAAVRFGGRQINGSPAINEEILTLWAIARIGDDIFQDGELYKDAISGADFDLIDWPNHVGSGPSDEKRQEFILNSILNDFW